MPGKPRNLHSAGRVRQKFHYEMPTNQAIYRRLSKPPAILLTYRLALLEFFEPGSNDGQALPVIYPFRKLISQRVRVGVPTT